MFAFLSAPADRFFMRDFHEQTGSVRFVNPHTIETKSGARLQADSRLIEQAWEMGAGSIRFIHGHGRGRGLSPGFINTNTGHFRRELRSDDGLRRWIKHTTLDCSDDGLTVVKLKRNPNPTRTEFDSVFPDRRFQNS